MSSHSNGLPVVLATTPADFDSIIHEFTRDLCREGIAKSAISSYRGPARHFLIWLDLEGIALEAVDGTTIDRFLRHDCDCRAAGLKRVYFWRKRCTSPHIMRLVRFLERAGRIRTPGDLAANLHILDGFLKGLRNDGYTHRTMQLYQLGCMRLIIWLHFSRIPLCDLNAKTYTSFRKSRFHCSIPGIYSAEITRSPNTAYGNEIRRFLQHLVGLGKIAPLEPEFPEKPLPESLSRFRIWLKCNRGISRSTLCKYTRLIQAVLPDLGQDPHVYDAELIRRVLVKHMENRSQDYARQLTVTMRMYLRFLASAGSVTGALVAAVPTVPLRRMGTLPRYIPTRDIERTIASCDANRSGVRDRAVLLLLARLALRAGDVAGLRLGDIDWNRAEIRVSGKTCRRVTLPLPQDVGDALYAYIATVRPKVDEEHVFLNSRAPFRPIGGSAVTSIARRALDRAGIATFATRGAHVFRHSRATGLLRDGNSLDMIQWLLRHDSPNTTMIYAKTDVRMLGEIAQPWIGGMAA